MAFDASVGGTASNSYVTVAEATAYFEASFGRSAWASSADQEALLISATRYLDLYLDWDGMRVSQDQALEWPRTGAYDKTGCEYSSTIIPMPVKFATYELAYHMLVNGDLSFEDQSIDRVKVGSIDVQFTERSVDSGIPKSIEAIVRHIGSTNLASASSVRCVPLERV
jgi:hypothetical protein